MPGSKHRETPVPYFKHSKCCSVLDVMVISLYLFVTLTKGVGRPGKSKQPGSWSLLKNAHPGTRDTILFETQPNCCTKSCTSWNSVLKKIGDESLVFLHHPNSFWILTHKNWREATPNPKSMKFVLEGGEVLGRGTKTAWHWGTGGWLRWLKIRGL